MTIGTKIAACRKRAGMSQEKLANELNISRQAVSRWETGEAVPDTEKVIQLSRIFHVTTDYLLLDIDEAPQSAAPAGNNRETEQRAAEKQMKRQSMRMHFGWFLLIFGIISLCLSQRLYEIFLCKAAVWHISITGGFQLCFIIMVPGCIQSYCINKIL